MKTNSITDPVSINPYYTNGTANPNNSLGSVQDTSTFAQLLSSIIYNQVNSSIFSIFDSSSNDSNDTFGLSPSSLGTSSVSSHFGGAGEFESLLTVLLNFRGQLKP